ncbi:RAMP superfamily CRISPR-associated protein [uncultured Thiohalocapsa sp.]|uniref:RAMP superfamily CRISPR-associated protein n=1 Tax=uncultured Thiohalocapsa sp. TaxID=768990 RepID=UPI0025F4ABEA|nr:RAMP superfamily CRISPR-associated protein [uncultured Thiohalocapsa sp.]
MRQPRPGLDAAAASAAWDQAGTARDGDWRGYDCRLVTPLYGGGVRPGEVDTELPIRAAALRGQLRFWWRIACGPFDSTQAMFRREAAIWGGLGARAPTASKVAVRVAKIARLQQGAAFVYQEQANKPGHFRIMPNPADWIEPYAVFPARGELSADRQTIEKSPHQLARGGLSFTLRLGLDPKLTDAQHEEVQTALRWWASFGGVGARTRRGLGAVYVRDLEPVRGEQVAARGGQLVLQAAVSDAERAWTLAVGRLSSFRQGEGIGRNPGNAGAQHPGRSRWPEPDMIRRQTHRHAPAHPPQHPRQDLYPRAAFGLPIVFHFKDERLGEPSQQQLVPVGGDRMASPLILRPYWDGQRWHPAAMLLPGWRQALGVVAEHGSHHGSNTAHPAWPKGQTAQAQAAAQIKPMASRGIDPLSAFMAFFEEH